MPGIKDYLFQDLPEEFKAVGIDKIRGGRKFYELVQKLGEAFRVAKGERTTAYKYPHIYACEKGLPSADSASALIITHLYGENLLLQEGAYNPISKCRIYIAGDETNGFYVEANVPGEKHNFQVITQVAASDTTATSIAASITDTTKETFTVNLTLDPDIAWKDHVISINNAIGDKVSVKAVGTYATSTTLKPTQASHGTSSNPKTFIGDGQYDIPGTGQGIRFWIGKQLIQDNTDPANTERFGSLSSSIRAWENDYIKLAVHKSVMVDGKAIDTTADTNLLEGARIDVVFEIVGQVKMRYAVDVVKY